MSQLSLPLDSSLLMRDDQGRYLPATADQILEAAQYVIDQKISRGTLFTSLGLVKDYLHPKLARFEHKVFAALFLDKVERQLTDPFPPDRARQANGSNGRTTACSNALGNNLDRPATLLTSTARSSEPLTGC